MQLVNVCVLNFVGRIFVVYQVYSWWMNLPMDKIVASYSMHANSALKLVICKHATCESKEGMLCKSLLSFCVFSLISWLFSSNSLMYALPSRGFSLCSIVSWT